MSEKIHTMFRRTNRTGGPRGTGGGIHGVHAGRPQAGQNFPENSVPQRPHRNAAGGGANGYAAGATGGAAGAGTAAGVPQFGQNRPSNAVPQREQTMVAACNADGAI